MEKIIRFEDYAVNDQFAYTMSRAIAAAKAEGATRIDIPQGVYKITPDWCAEKSVCISNHGWNGPHRFIALIEDMADLTLDFHGSTLDCEGIITPFAILRSRNIRIENDFTVEYLRKLGFEWSDIDFEYIKRYIEYFRNIGYLEV